MHSSCKYIARILQETNLSCKNFARNISLLQETSLSCKNLERNILFVQQKFALRRFFTSLPTDDLKCGNVGFKLVVSPVVLKKENFNR